METAAKHSKCLRRNYGLRRETDAGRERDRQTDTHTRRRDIDTRQ